MKIKVILIAVLFIIALCFMFTCPSAAQHEKVNIVMLGTRPGMDFYAYSLALANLVNDYSDWLRIDVKTTIGGSPNVKTMMTHSAEDRKITIAVAADIQVNQAKQGKWPFEDLTPYDGLRYIASFGMYSDIFATYDPEIKTIEDFKGKQVMVHPLTWSGAICWKILVEQVWKNADSVNWSHGYGNEIIDALRDGVIDVGWVDVNGPIGGPYEPGEELSQALMLKPGMMFIGIPQTHLELMSRVGSAIVNKHEIPPGSYGPNQTEPVYGVSNNQIWLADKAMSDDVTYEIVKLLYEHSDAFFETLPNATITRDTLADIPVPDVEIHLGALKFYKEIGLR